MISEAEGTSVPMSAPENGADTKQRIRLDRVLAALETQLDLAGIRIGDPRFRWLGTAMTPKPSSATPLLDALRCLVADESTELDERIERLEHVRDYVVELEAQDLEDELAGILGPVVGRPGTQSVRLPAMTRRLGWDGQPPATLEEVGDQLGVTRERVRQIELTVDAGLHEHGCWTPVLDRAIRILAREAPIPFDRVGAMLVRARLTTNASFSAESLLSAQRLLSDHSRLADSTVHDVRFVVRVGETLDVPWLSAARSTIQRRVSNQGIAEIAAVIADAAGEGAMLTAKEIEQAACWNSRWELIDGQWIVPTDLDVRNPLLNRIRKVLSVAPGIALPTLFTQLSRYSRNDHEFDVPIEGLRAFARWHPILTLDPQDRVQTTVPIAPEDVLSDSELVIRATLGTADSVAYATVVEAMEASGLTRVSASVVLRDSPIVIKVARNAYRLVSTSTQPEIAALDEDEDPDFFEEPEVVGMGVCNDAIGAMDLVEQVPDSDSAEPTEREPSDTVNTGNTADTLLVEEDDLHEDAMDDARVQRIIAVTMGRIADLGCTTHAAVASDIRQHDPAVTPEMVKEVLDHTDGILWLDGDWITCFDGSCDNPLRKRIETLARKDRRITPNTVRVHGRIGASIPDRVYKRLIDRYATWQSVPPPEEAVSNDGSDEPDRIGSPEQATPAKTPPNEVTPRGDHAHPETILRLHLFDPVETQPPLGFDPSSLQVADASPGHQNVAPHAEPAFPEARDDRALLDTISTPEFAAYYDAAATKLGHDADSVYAAFDLIPPEMVRWLRGNLERIRRVRILMAEDDGDIDAAVGP